MEVLTLDIISALINALKYANINRLIKLEKRAVLTNLLSMEIDENITYQATMASFLKDIGKIGVREVKEKRMNYKSSEIMRIMPEIIPFQYNIADIILESNEKIDGTGCPSNKEDVLIEAQIIVIVEEYLKTMSFEELSNEKRYNRKIVLQLKKLLENGKIIDILNDEKKLNKVFSGEINKYNVYKEQLEGVEEEQFMHTIASIIDAKHQYTGGHTQRVATFSYAIAKNMGYEKEKLSEIRYAAYLHDIGKLAVDLDILDKPGKLTDEEFEKIKLHAKYSYDILSDSPRLRKFAFGALHHEKMDGTGYPFGLKGDEIPEGSRLIAIADILDALTSDRNYRKPFTFKEAFELMEMMKGTALDSKIFDIAKTTFNI
ncbi:HD-GYP domain-containing protein [Haliovirga abyssi]|uniref:HD-GYP domain-containing protein n=1 Tax=Haliovirga abyssi TaxID=2996794 RepID=A0AAU9DRT6_9FUSO|nr:HD-GYP domain-containing protein [Haliovirga abyssi]BDU49674.1 hypothetical protein HLVA_02430 [Haliovirga abyssi]